MALKTSARKDPDEDDWRQGQKPRNSQKQSRAYAKDSRSGNAKQKRHGPVAFIVRGQDVVVLCPNRVNNHALAHDTCQSLDFMRVGASQELPIMSNSCSAAGCATTKIQPAAGVFSA
jgi:hypothetical protein